MEALVVVIVILVIIVLGLASSSVRVLREYERGVVFRLGRLIDLKDPGLLLLIPVVDRMERVDLRVITLNVPAQDVITKDNVPVRVTAVAYFKVIDANRAIVDVENYYAATSQIAQTSLRAILGKADLDTLLSERERLNEDLQKVIDQQTEPWGIKVSIVEIKDVDVPEGMQRAIARQAEAERERRAKVINAAGEFQASKQLAAAADVMSENPTTLQLRYLQTLAEVGSNAKSSVVIPLPLDVVRAVTPMLGKDQGASVVDTVEQVIDKASRGAKDPVEEALEEPAAPELPELEGLEDASALTGRSGNPS